MKLILTDKKQETGNIYSFIFKSQKPLVWKTGQFLIYELKHKNPDLRGIQRFFTVSSAPFENQIMLSTKILKENASSFKQALKNMKKGDIIEARGPDGNFTIEDPNKNYIFIAGGIGITPYRSILLELNHKKLPINVSLFYANKDKEFAFKKELNALIKTNPNFKIYYVLRPKRIDEKLIRENIKNIKDKIFYVSGPNSMVEDLSKMLKKIGIGEKNIKEDYFPGYKNY